MLYIDLEETKKFLSKRDQNMIRKIVNRKGYVVYEPKQNWTEATLFIWRNIVFLLSDKNRHQYNPYMTKGYFEMDYNSEIEYRKRNNLFQNYRPLINKVVDYIMLRDWFPDKEWEMLKHSWREKLENRRGSYNIKRRKVPKGWIG